MASIFSVADTSPAFISAGCLSKSEDDISVAHIISVRGCIYYTTDWGWD
jgi:hypothetical protein